MLDGFYALYYTGSVSSGFAMIVLRSGIVTGADAGGGLYDGNYAVNADKRTIEGTLKLTTPAGLSSNRSAAKPICFHAGNSVLISR
jgi:hypothetical protein